MGYQQCYMFRSVFMQEKEKLGEEEKKNRLGVKINVKKIKIICPKIFKMSNVVLVLCKLHRKTTLIIDKHLF